MRVALSGPSGSGKTTSALLMAYGITGDWSKIALIDTEHNSAEHYAVSSTLGTTEEDTFNVLELEAPYTPDRYIQAIETCEQADGIEVIVIDSASHEWNGKGGILEMKDSVGGKSSFNAWEKVTPEHNKFIEKMLSSSCHLFACFRTKTDYILVDKNGKQVPEKVGLKAITRDEVDYEFSVWFDLDIRNTAEATKDRTELFKGKPDFRITKETGSMMKVWADAGKTEVQLAIEELKSCSDRECTTGVYNKYKHLHSNEQFIAAVKEMAKKYPKEPAPEPEQKQEPVQQKEEAAAQTSAQEQKPVEKSEPAPVQQKQDPVSANKPGMITEAQKQEVMRLTAEPELDRKIKVNVLLGLNQLTEEQAAKRIAELKQALAACQPEKPAHKVPAGLEAEEDLVHQIKLLITDEVFTLSEAAIVERRLTSITKLQARELLDDVKKTIRDRREGVAA